jgi:hypothetical protein
MMSFPNNFSEMPDMAGVDATTGGNLECTQKINFFLINQKKLQMDNDNFIKDIITGEITGKNNAIHAYDKLIWTVRSGFLTLVFAGWSLTVKAAVENNVDFLTLMPFAFILSGFSLSLAAGAFVIDRNYARRKFRVINGVNHLMQLLTDINFNTIELKTKNELTNLLKISGDTDNKKYISGAYKNEIMVSRVIYLVPSVLISAIILYYL